MLQRRVGWGTAGLPVASLLTEKDAQLAEGLLVRIWGSEGFPTWA